MFLLVLPNFSHQLSLNCSFTTHSSYLGSEYCCIVNNLHTSHENRRITEVIGAHEGNNTNKDVKKIFIKFQNCPYLPLNLGEHFPNLEIFYTLLSNVQHILPGDLDGLNNLKKFDVSHNPVEEIPADFFNGHEAIETISFFDCHLKKVAKASLDVLQNIQTVSFSYNFCVDMTFQSEVAAFDFVTAQTFFADVYDKCNGHGYVVKSHKPVVCESVEKFPTSAKLGIAMMVILILVTAILGAALICIYSKNFQKNWHELQFPIIEGEN